MKRFVDIIFATIAAALLLAESGVYFGRYGGTDFSRYLDFFLKAPAFPSFDLGAFGVYEFGSDHGFNALIYVAKSFGFAFELFLTVLVTGYIFICLKTTRLIVGRELSLFVKIVTTAIACFWAHSLFLVVLRQGVASLYILFCVFVLNRFAVSLLFAGIFHKSYFVLAPVSALIKIRLDLRVYDFFFFVISIFYVTGAMSVISDWAFQFFQSQGIDLRSLEKTGGAYMVGFSFYKLLASGLVYLFARFACHLYPSEERCRYFLLIIFCVSCVGFILSGLPYHDRFLLIGWAVSPIVIPVVISRLRLGPVRL